MSVLFNQLLIQFVAVKTKPKQENLALNAVP